MYDVRPFGQWSIFISRKGAKKQRDIRLYFATYFLCAFARNNYSKLPSIPFESKMSFLFTDWRTSYI
jgi:hypothetical protein